MCFQTFISSERATFVSPSCKAWAKESIIFPSPEKGGIFRKYQTWGIAFFMDKR
jgi:hypothetical protein